MSEKVAANLDRCKVNAKTSWIWHPLGWQTAHMPKSLPRWWIFKLKPRILFVLLGRSIPNGYAAIINASENSWSLSKCREENGTSFLLALFVGFFHNSLSSSFSSPFTQTNSSLQRFSSRYTTHANSNLQERTREQTHNKIEKEKLSSTEASEEPKTIKGGWKVQNCSPGFIGLVMLTFSAHN